MATSKRTTRASAAEETARPAQPSWRQPPAQPRKRRRRNQAATPQVAIRAADTAARPWRAPKERVEQPAHTTSEVVRRIVLILFTVGLAAGLVLLLQAPQFAISATSTQIGGAQRVTADRIYTISGLEGRSVFLVRSDEVASRITQEPGIAAAGVHVRLPNQVLIDVQEYVPVVAWQGITTTVWLTADGVEVPQAGAEPLLRLSDRTGLTLDESRVRWPRVLSEVMALQEVLPQATELYYGQLEGLYFRSPEGWTVWLGDTGQVAAKLALLNGASNEIMAQGAQPQVIDLRFSDRQALWW